MKKNHVIEMLPARKYYGPHATGSVILVDGQVHTHAKTREVRRMYNDLIKEQKERAFFKQTQKVYVVVTTQNDGEDDNFMDVVLITRSKPRAARLAKKLQSGKKIRGLDTLKGYENATYFERTLEDTSIFKDA